MMSRNAFRGYQTQSPYSSFTNFGGGFSAARPRPGLDKYRYGDGLLSLIGSAAKAIVKPIAKLIPKNTIVGKMASAVGWGATGAAVGSALIPSAAPALPALSSVSTSGIPGVPAAAVAGGGIGAMLPWWKGAGGKLQFPWQDPKMLEGLKPPFVLDDAYLKIMYRAPRGYVVVKDPNGKAYCMARFIAVKMGLFNPASKPPISAGDWRKFQTARSVEKKLRKIAGKGLRKSTRTVYANKKR